MSVTLGEKRETCVFLHNAHAYGRALYGALYGCRRQESGPKCARARLKIAGARAYSCF